MIIFPEAIPTFLSTSVYLIIFITILSWVYWRLVNSAKLKIAKEIPEPPGSLPFFGHALTLLGMNHNEIFNLACAFTKQQTGKVLKAWAGPRLFVALYDPRDIEIILSSNVYLDKSEDYRMFQPWFGNGLFISSGLKWRTHRKLIAPTFHLDVLKSFIDLFNKNSQEVVDKLDKEVSKEFDCHDYMSEATVEILLETVMGVDKKSVIKSGHEYAMAVMKMCSIIHSRHTKLWLNPDFFFKFTKYKTLQIKLLAIIKGLTSRVVKTKRNFFEKGNRGSAAIVPDEIKSINANESEYLAPDNKKISFGQISGLRDDLDVDDNSVGEKKRMPFLDSLIEASKNTVDIDDSEVIDQVNTIMFKGHDTTATASSFFLCMMGTHPEIQQRVQQELYEIFGDSDRPATFDDTLEMKYLERCLMETLRLYPPVPMITRHITENIKLRGKDLIIPADTTIIIGIYCVHQDAAVYPNPKKFDPDNFLPERMVNRHHYAFIPFSAGPRSCVGRKYAVLKLKILLSTIMRNFHITSTVLQDQFKLQADIILKRSDGFNIILERRKCH